MKKKPNLSQQTPDKILNHNLCFFNLSGEYKDFKNMELVGVSSTTELSRTRTYSFREMTIHRLIHKIVGGECWPIGEKHADHSLGGLWALTLTKKWGAQALVPDHKLDSVLSSWVKMAAATCTATPSHSNSHTWERPEGSSSKPLLGASEIERSWSLLDLLYVSFC